MKKIKFLKRKRWTLLQMILEKIKIFLIGIANLVDSQISKIEQTARTAT